MNKAERQEETQQIAVPLKVIEILGDSSFNGTQKSALKIISESTEQSRGNLIFGRLLDIACLVGDRVQPETYVCRDVIKATSASFLSHTARLKFFEDIADHPFIKGCCVEELRFTAATLSLEVDILPDFLNREQYANKFACLFLRSAGVSLRQLAEFWHLKSEQEVIEFFSQKYEEVANGAIPQFWSLVMIKLREQLKEDKLDLLRLCGPRSKTLALPALISEAAHKRISAAMFEGQLAFIASQVL
jgi:hypothetical protein